MLDGPFRNTMHHRIRYEVGNHYYNAGHFDKVIAHRNYFFMYKEEKLKFVELYHVVFKFFSAKKLIQAFLCIS